MNYFKEMNEVENDDIEIVINLNEDNHDDYKLLITLKHFPDILFSKNICHRPTLHILPH
jgi:hypothetical protein